MKMAEKINRATDDKTKYIRIRNEAEKRFREKQFDFNALDIADQERLLEELQIGQIELELQNQELSETQLQLEHLHEQYLDLYNEAPVGYLSLNDAGTIIRANFTIARMFGVSPYQLKGRPLTDFMVTEDRAQFLGRYNAFARKPDGKLIDLRFNRKNDAGSDSIFVGRIQGRRQMNSLQSDLQNVSRSISLLIVISDVTELKLSEKQVRFEAYHDNLTGLPNRRNFTDRLDGALAKARRHSGFGTLLFMDMDRFKYVNDSLGHHAGDELLVKFSARLRKNIRREDMLARLGGDEFVILLDAQEGDRNLAAKHARQMADNLIQSLEQPVMIMEVPIQVTISIGVAIFPLDYGDTVGDVIRQADTAMYKAKGEGRNLVKFFHMSLEQQVKKRLLLESELRQALAREEFEIHYQPQCTPDGEISGAEALLRWRHPEKGIVYPGDFIDALEESGLILGVGGWVMDQVFKQTAAWLNQAAITPNTRISINISAAQIRIENFVEQVEQLIDKHGLDPRVLVFEITETLLMPNDQFSQVTLERLSRLGLCLSVDDFGTGYSSISLLQKTHIDQIKIAQQFVAQLKNETTLDGLDETKLALVRAIVTMADALGLDIIAEGVETSLQSKVLAEMGCEVMQGYLYSKPVPIDAMTHLWQQKHMSPP